MQVTCLSTQLRAIRHPPKSSNDGSSLSMLGIVLYHFLSTCESVKTAGKGEYDWEERYTSSCLLELWLHLNKPAEAMISIWRRAKKVLLPDTLG